MWEVGKYRVREARKGGVSTYYPQQLLRSFWWTHHWDNFYGFCAVPYSFGTYAEAVSFINDYIAKKESEKVTKVTYHNVEI